MKAAHDLSRMRKRGGREAEFYIADVFTDRLFGGNQLAVFPDARGMNGVLMQRIARELNFSESVFVLPAEHRAHVARLRIFTPLVEMPFAGHPTVGTAHVLAGCGRIRLTGPTTRVTLGEKAGPVAVTIRSRRGRPTFAQLTAPALPAIGAPPPGLASLAAMLSLETADLMDATLAPQTVSCGTPFLLVPLRTPEAVSRAKPNLPLFERTLRDPDHHKVMVFALDAARSACIRARMFGPAVGIPEDPATGSGAAAIAAYLAARAPLDGTMHWTIDQGAEMGRPSRIAIEADRTNGRVSAARIGGSTVIVSHGVMRLSPPG